ncbi:MAG TPA: DinB family protein [Granulicella sp.]|nr:DinB family protein [Granulicella sp.]
MTGRPMESEAAEYCWSYINSVEGEDAVAALEKQLAEALALFAGIAEERSLGRYAAGKWSMREVLSHVSDTERIFSFRALWFARGLGKELPGFDQDVAAANAAGDRLGWAAHVEEFRRVREGTIALFRSMPEEAWSRSGVANGNSSSVRALAFMAAGHAEHHLRILRERYLG